MAAQKDVKIKLATEADLKEVEALENKINEIKRQKLQLNIEANTSKLQETEKRIQGLKIFLDNVNHGNTPIHIDDSEIKKAEQELDALESDKINIQLAIETDKLNAAKSELDSLDNTTLDVDVNNISAMESIDQIGQGFDRLKQGASEVGQEFGSVLESAGRMEQTEAFLSMNLGADQAKSKLAEIRSVTDALPGDDVVLQNLLSQAAIKDLSLAKDDFQQMGNAAADYMAAMQNYGKTATETQQDLMNYILTGNTAEIELSPILASHVDQLKEGTTVKERSLLLQQALNEEHWGGIASQDIYNNKFQQFNDMIERGKMNLGNYFLEGSEGAMDWIMNLDNATGGLVGLTVAMAGFASPVADTMMGIGQMAMGFQGLSDMYKMLIPEQIAEGTAGWFSIGWIAFAIVLGLALGAAFVYLYQNCDWFREGVDNLAQTLQWLATTIWDTVVNALQGLWDYITTLGGLLPANVELTGNQILDTVLRVMAFMATLPLQIGMIFVNIIAQALGFGPNFSQNMIKGAVDAVNGFIQWITTLPGKLEEELNKMLEMAGNFALQIADKLSFGGASMVWGWVTGSGEHSPGHMYDALLGELSAMLNLPGMLGTLANDVGSYAMSMADQFTMALWGIHADVILDEIITQLLNFASQVLSISEYIVTIGGLLPLNVDITGNAIIDGILRVLLFIGSIPYSIAAYFVNIIAETLGFGQNFSQRMLSAGFNAVNSFMSNITSLPGKLANELQNMLSAVSEWAATLPQKFWDAGVNAVQNFLNALGIHSPGTMQTMMVWEVSEMGRRVPLEGRKLLSNISQLGEDVVSEFGSPSLGLSFDETANASIIASSNDQLAGQVNNFYFSDIVVDNDDRMQKIVDYVTRELAWNNRTAGRTV